MNSYENDNLKDVDIFYKNKSPVFLDKKIISR